ncbi:MAG: glycosyltransferase [Candidatus Micrarchaeia archaeon]
MKIAAVIVTFNRLQKLKLTLKRTLEEDLDYIIVVNNASTDGTKEWLNSLNLPQLRIINLEKNVGGAGGFHIGFKEVAFNTDADWLVCYDDDAYPQTDAIKKFRSLQIDSNTASIAASVYLPNGEISEMNRPSFNPFWHLKYFFKTVLYGRKGFHVNDLDYKKVDCIEIDSSSFVGYFIRTDIIQNVGLPRKELFLYADDIIYTLMVKKAGYKHLFCPVISFIHDCETLVEQRSIYSPLWKAYYTFRNALEMYRFTSGYFFYPIALIKILSWFKKSKYYPNPKLYRYLTWLAIIDGLKRNFNRTHEEIISLSTNKK